MESSIWPFGRPAPECLCVGARCSTSDTAALFCLHTAGVVHPALWPAHHGVGQQLGGTLRATGDTGFAPFGRGVTHAIPRPQRPRLKGGERKLPFGCGSPALQENPNARTRWMAIALNARRFGCARRIGLGRHSFELAGRTTHERGARHMKEKFRELNHSKLSLATAIIQLRVRFSERNETRHIWNEIRRFIVIVIVRWRTRGKVHGRVHSRVHHTQR